MDKWQKCPVCEGKMWTVVLMANMDMEYMNQKEKCKVCDGTGLLDKDGKPPKVDSEAGKNNC